MRKVLGIITVLLAVFVFAGCSRDGGVQDGAAKTDDGKLGASSSIMDVLGDDMLAIYENRDKALPAAVIYIYQGNGERVESPLYSEDDINAVLDAITEITITGETDMTVADSDSSYTFINSDGTEAGSVSFNGKFLACGDKKYEIENKKALAAIDFPAATDRDTLTIDGPDPKMYEFLERCKTEEPVCVKVIRNGSEREITDAETIDEAVNALHSVSLAMFAFQGTEEPSTRLTVSFIMQDGEEYNLTFYDDYYIYEYPQPLGVWSFCTDGAEYFIEILEKEK